MDAGFRPEVSIAVPKTRSRGVARAIQCRADARVTSRMESPGLAAELKTEFPVSEFQLKYLILAAVVSVVTILIYSRLHPYLQLIRKVLAALNVSTQVTTTSRDRAAASRAPSKNKLVRCDSCGTWVPADRVIRVGSGLANYCSSECLVKHSESREKLAG